VAGIRTIQPRVVVASAPVIILGGLIHTQGWARARHMVFPLSMFAFVIPMPGFQQATTGLQLIATKMAHHASKLFGMTTVLAGNKVYDPDGNWGSWEIDEGCSGIRSLVALMLVTYVYGMIVHKKWSERFLIFAACIPVAIVANAVRVTSILVVAKYYSLDFAKSTWHDYSGFLSFGTALALLMLLSAILKQGLRVLKPKVKVTKVSGPPKPQGPGSVQSKPADSASKASSQEVPASLPVADPY
jgi:exosortase